MHERVPLRACGVKDFLRDPVGRCVEGPTYLAWCHDGTLCGTVFWGTPSLQDARAVTRLFEIDRHRDMAPVFDVVCDGRRVQRLDVAAFGVLAAYLASRLGEYRRRFRRNAIVYPPGLVGAAMSGLYPLLGARHRWRGFRDTTRAFAWLGRPDALAVGAEVDRLAESLATTPELVRRLRLAVGEDLRGARLSSVARAMGVSARTLQRTLRDSGSTFRREISLARVDRASRLLTETDDKLDAIARRVGFASVSQLSTAFRRATGEPPSAFRARRRGSGP